MQDANNNIFTIDPPLPGPIMSVPEPSTLVLAALGLLVLLGLARRRRK